MRVIAIDTEKDLSELYKQITSELLECYHFAYLASNQLKYR